MMGICVVGMVALEHANRRRSGSVRGSPRYVCLFILFLLTVGIICIMRMRSVMMVMM